MIPPNIDPKAKRNDHDSSRHLAVVFRLGCSNLKRFLACNFFTVCLAFATVVIVSGCSKFGKIDTSSDTNATYKHDFGLLLAPANESWQFELHNSFGKRITLKHFSAGCRCVTASLDPVVLEPGTTGKVVVGYVADVGPRDEVQTLRVVFEELSLSDCPTIRLTARVRNRMHLSVPALDWTSVDGPPSPKKFDVENYSDQAWERLSIQAPEWLEFVVSPVITSRQEQSKSVQTWRVELTPPSDLPWGDYRGEVEVMAGGHQEYRQKLDVSMLLRSRIRFYPTRIVLGPNIPEMRVDVSVEGSSDATLSKNMPVELSNPLPDFLDITQQETELGQYSITIELKQIPEEAIETEVRLALPEVSNRPIFIPITLKSN